MLERSVKGVQIQRSRLRQLAGDSQIPLEVRCKRLALSSDELTAFLLTQALHTAVSSPLP